MAAGQDGCLLQGHAQRTPEPGNHRSQLKKYKQACAGHLTVTCCFCYLFAFVYFFYIFLHTKLLNYLSLVAPGYCNGLSLQHHYYKAVCHYSSALIHFKGIHKFIFSFETLAEQWCVSKSMCAHTKILKLFLSNFLHFQCLQTEDNADCKFYAMRSLGQLHWMMN